MRMLHPPRRFNAFAILLFVLSSCGGGQGTLYPVSGRATVDGEPLKEARLVFMPDAGKGNKTEDAPVGEVKDGAYSLTTRGKPGAPAGWYKVQVRTRYPGGPKNPVALPQRYSDPGESPLSIEVISNPAADAYDLKLTSR